MRLLLVCGPWGSGTTAVTQLLQAMGAYVPGPHFPTYDPRTPNSLETWPFKRLLEQFVDAETMSLKEDAGFERALETYKATLDAETTAAPNLLKHALTAAVLPQICQTFDTRVIFVVRPFAGIHATRLRRGWREGSVESAELVYERMNTFIAEAVGPYTIVYYDELRAIPAQVAERLAAFTGLPASAAALEVIRSGD